jgi:hypothetical protein
MVWVVLVLAALAAAVLGVLVHQRTGPRVPEAQIAAEDLDLVRDADRAAWRRVRLSKYRRSKQQDDFYRIAAYKKALADGMSPAEAKAHIRKSYPIYYLDPATRDDEGYAGVDAALPVLLRERVEKGAPKLKALIAEHYAHLKSMNALIRELIRKGAI